MPGNQCSNCIAYSLECTYVEAAKVCPVLPGGVGVLTPSLPRNVVLQKGVSLHQAF